MTKNIVHMGLRGMTVIMMILLMFYTSEYPNLTATEHFFMCGVYGSYIIITFGLLVEAGLLFDSDKLIEVLLLGTATVLNIICAILSFKDFLAVDKYKSQSIIKGVISTFSSIVYLVDLATIILTE